MNSSMQYLALYIHISKIYIPDPILTKNLLEVNRRIYAEYRAFSYDKLRLITKNRCLRDKYRLA